MSPAHQMRDLRTKSPSSVSRPVMRLLVALPLTGALASPALAHAAQPAGPATLEVVLTNDGCTPTPATVNAGSVTFSIRNVGGDRVTELELLRDDVIV